MESATSEVSSESMPPSTARMTADVIIAGSSSVGKRGMMGMGMPEGM